MLGIIAVCLCLLWGDFLSHIMPIALPASLWGFASMFILLHLHPPLYHWVKPLTRPVVKHLSLFFVPIGVSIVEVINPLKEQWLWLLPLILFSTLLIGTLTAWIFQRTSPRYP
jgi:holin-like protein